MTPPRLRSVSRLLQILRMKSDRTAILPAALLPLALFVGCQQDTSGMDPNAVKLGVLLPFTGSGAAAGTSLERAMVLAVESINANGGVLERPFALNESDTRGDVNRTESLVGRLTSDPNLVALIGPDEATLAVSTRATVVQATTTWLLPSAFGPDISSLYFPPRLFMLGPEVTSFTRAVYARMQADGVLNPVILHDLDPNDIRMANDLVTFAADDKRHYQAPVTLNPDSTTYADVASDVVTQPPDAIVLFAFPTIAATLINEIAALGIHGSSKIRWYLGPPLQSEVLLQNVVPGILEGAIGVGAGCEANGASFSDAYANRWEGDVPLLGAPYYYDATVLVALALEARHSQSGGSLPSPDELSQAIRTVASPPGTVVQWNQVALALELVRQGEDIDYQGVCNSLDFDSMGVSQDAPVDYWRIADNTIGN